MIYVVTFNCWDTECESFTVNASCIESAIMEAKEKANENSNRYYSDDSVLSVIRV